MMEQLTRAEELEQAQRKLEKGLRAVAKDFREVKLGFYGGHVKAEVGWIPQENLWFHCGRRKKRWWNPFGLGEPKAGQMQRIVAQINPQIEGSSALSAGAFVRDGSRILVCHKGRFTIGKQSVSLEWGAPKITVGDRSLFVVADLERDDLVARIADFVRAVSDAKLRAIADDDEDDEVDGESGSKASTARLVATGPEVDSYWKVAPDRGAALWPTWVRDGVVSIGWPELGDLSDLDQEGFEERVREYQRQYPEQKRGSLDRVWRFRHIPVGAR